MRNIIHEQTYERPLSSGRLRYERDGVPTGAVESWRLTEAVDGYRFLRVDLDARDAPSGRSTLYHVTINPLGRPEQVKFRYLGDGREISGTIFWDRGEIVAVRTVDGRTVEETADDGAFWFPAGAGLAMLSKFVGVEQGVTLVTDASRPAGLMALLQTPVTVEWGRSAMELIDGDPLPIRMLSVAWHDQRREIWLDAQGRPMQLWRDDGLTATAERLVQYS